ncbi:hypothetical protein ACQP3D_28265, partial [Escherichia coli]
LQSWGLNPVKIWQSLLRDHYSKNASIQAAKGPPLPTDCYHPSFFPFLSFYHMDPGDHTEASSLVPAALPAESPASP